jgi:hypothetical protein
MEWGLGQKQVHANHVYIDLPHAFHRHVQCIHRALFEVDVRFALWI